jgi:hypothetical protein
MLEIFFELIARFVFGMIAEAILQPILERIFRLFDIPVVDEFFSVLAKILAIFLVCLVLWMTYHFVNVNIQ